MWIAGVATSLVLICNFASFARADDDDVDKSPQPNWGFFQKQKDVMRERQQGLKEERQGQRNEFRQQRAEWKEDGKERREQVRERRLESVEARLHRHADRLDRRFTFYYSRLTLIADKIEKRLSVLSSDGKDVTDARAKLAEARSQIEAAKALGNQAVAAFSSIMVTDDRDALRAAIKSAKDIVKQTREACRSAVSLLKETVRLVRGVSAEEQSNT